MKRKKWVISPLDEDRAKALVQCFGISAIAAKVLSARGILPENAADFLDTSLSKLHDPFLLADMDKAVEIINTAIADGEKIAIYGDYDVDGVTSTCVLVKYLRSRGAECAYYIPDRISEGYGLNLCAIEQLYKDGCRLMITVDSGITAVAEAEFACSLGLKLIITDHHQCQETPPCALAIVNPRRRDNKYPFCELAGVGVAFKLVCALERETPIEKLIELYGDLVAAGTVADVMTLTDENRAIVAHGLKNLATTHNTGLKVMMQKLGIDSDTVSANSVSFTMAPRINAAGRLGSAFKAVELFLTDDVSEAECLAEELCELNRRRQETENSICEEVTARLANEFDPARDKCLVMWGENWHNGVIGIVSSRIADRINAPVVLIALDGDCGKGSGRSVCGFNLYGALEKCSSVLEKFGGHELAAGITIKRENLEAFRKLLNENANQCLCGEENISQILVDILIEPKDATTQSIRSLQKLEPFGMGNPQPIFCMRDMEIEGITPISRDRHTKMQLAKNGASFSAFMFGMGSNNCPFASGDIIDCVFSAEISAYRGRENVQFVMKDIIFSVHENEVDDAAFKIYKDFIDGAQLSPKHAEELLPTRAELIAVFRHIKQQSVDCKLRSSPRALYRKIKYEAAPRMNLGKLMVCLDIFAEFDIFLYETANENLEITVLIRADKADINGSKILKRLIESTKQ